MGRQTLPKVLYATDVIFDKDSTLESIACLFINAKFVNGEYMYERRTLRVIIQERLHPLKALTDVREFGQVFLGIACGKCLLTPQLLLTYCAVVHRWLYDRPGILYRDLSPNNIMCRIVKSQLPEGSRSGKCTAC